MKQTQLIFCFLLAIHFALAVDYHPPGYFNSGNVTNVTWAHGVNSVSDLDANIKDGSIRMLEADLVIGHLKGHENESATVIMAQPPENISDLSFEMFLNRVIEYNQNKSLENRKGIKLDFKEFEAANMSLPLIQQKRDENETQVMFPIWVNADILPGPINASANKVDGRMLMELQKQYSPQSTLSIGWTTRYGILLPRGSYSKEQVEEMAELIKSVYNEEDNRRVEITFPLRAGLALQSLENIKFLLNEAGINFTSPSVTLWEGATDPKVKREELDGFIEQIGAGRVFVDLPHSFPKDSNSGGFSVNGKYEVIIAMLVMTCFFQVFLKP